MIIQNPQDVARIFDEYYPVTSNGLRPSPVRPQEKNASFSVDQSPQGDLLLHDFGGATTQQILDAIKAQHGVEIPMSSLFAKPYASLDKHEKKVIEKIYKYSETFEVIRYLFRDKNGYRIDSETGKLEKTFSQRQLINGHYVWGSSAGKYYQGSNGDYYRLKDKQKPPAGAKVIEFAAAKPPPYRLKDLQNSVGLVLFLEGEKCSDFAADVLGFVATCVYGGASKPWQDYYADHFKGRDVVIIGDNDDAGRNFALLVATKLYGVARSVKILNLQYRSEKDDIVEWSQAEGNDAERLKAIIDETPTFAPKIDLGFGIRMRDVVHRPVQFVVEDWIARGKLALIFGESGSGKTSLIIKICAGITTGSLEILRLSSDLPGDIIYCSSEDDINDTLFYRFEAAGADPDRVIFLPYGNVYGFAEHEENFIKTLAAANNPSAVIWDTGMSYMGAANPNSSTDVRRALNAVIEKILKRFNVPGIFISHTNKSATTARALDRHINSAAFVQLPRFCGLCVKPNEPSRPKERILVPAKNNLGKISPGLSYDLEIINNVPVARLVHKSVEISADEALQYSSPGIKLTENAENQILEKLSEGTTHSQDLERHVTTLGTTTGTYKEARRILTQQKKITKFKSGSRWFYSLNNAAGAATDTLDDLDDEEGGLNLDF